jgi:hypothetical protein
MARLTAADRRKLSSKEFAGPGRSFPIPDAGHARAALIDVNKAKNLTSGEKAHIRAVAREKLRHGVRD